MNYTHYNVYFEVSYSFSHSLTLFNSLHQNLFLSCWVKYYKTPIKNSLNKLCLRQNGEGTISAVIQRMCP